MITPSFSLTATERVLPKMALDFTTDILDSRVTLARSGNTATVINSLGYVETINANLPRFDYDPVTLVSKGLLIEESRTNLRTRSEEFENSVWSKSGLSVSADAFTSPSNTLTADKLIEDAANSAHFIFGQVTGLSISTYTWSVFAKAAERNFIFLTEGNNITATAFFDLSTGTIGNVTGTGSPSATITNFGDGWFRCALTATIIAGVHNCQIRLSTGNGVSTYQGDGTSGVYLWGAELEEGAFSTSYIPTVASQVTRNADVATMTGTNFSDFYNATEGSVVVQVLPSTISGTRPAVEFDDNTANELIVLRGLAADPQLFVVDGGATQATLDAGTIAANTLYKLGGAWKNASYAVALNGAAPVTQSSGTFPAATQARLGSDGTNFLNGHLQSLRFWSQRITNAEVQAFSK